MIYTTNRVESKSSKFNRALRICHVAMSYWPAHGLGGPVVSDRNLDQELARLGAKVTVVTSDVGIPQQWLRSVNREYRSDGYRIRYLRARGGHRLAIGLRFLGRISVEVRRADVVRLSAVWNPPVYWAAICCMITRTPYIVSTRGTLYPETIQLGKAALKRFAIRMFVRPLLGFSGGIHVTVPSERESVLNVSKRLRVDKILLLPNIVEVDRKTAEGRESDELFPPMRLPEQYILFLGRITEKKRPALLARAFAVLALEFSELHLVFVGPIENGLAAQIRSLLGRAGLQNRLHFLGMIPNSQVGAIYRNASVFVLPSISENFGNAVVEAIICSTPVVVTPSVGCSEYFDSSTEITLIDGSAQSITQAISKLLTRKQETANKVRRAHNRAVKLFEPVAVAKSYESFLMRMLRESERKS